MAASVHQINAPEDLVTDIIIKSSSYPTSRVEKTAQRSRSQSSVYPEAPRLNAGTSRHLIGEIQESKYHAGESRMTGSTHRAQRRLAFCFR